MPHTIEPATTSRSKCRACGVAIAKAELRFGERLPNPFGDEGSETTHWYHVRCGAYRRPESFAELLDTDAAGLEDHALLKDAVKFGCEFRRVERINGVQRAASGRARCRHCRATISKDEWRIPLVFFEEGVANPAGFIHVACAGDYFETTGILDRLLHFGTDLEDADTIELQQELNRSATNPGD